MKFLSYLYYRLFKHFGDEPNINARKFYILMNIGGLIMINIFAILVFVLVIFDLHLLDFIETNNRAMNRFVIIPLLISPIFITLFLIYKKNRTYIESTQLEFSLMNTKQKSKLNFYFWFYIIFSIFLLFSAATSPLWLGIRR